MHHTLSPAAIMPTDSINVVIASGKHQKHKSESNQLLSDSVEYPDINDSNNNTFVFEKSILKESCIIFNLSLQIGFSIAFEVGIGTISTIFLGHLPNASQILSGTGMAYSFCNVTAIGISWGFASALWTLIPQAVGANTSNQTKLIAIYVQRAFVVCMLLEVPLSILLFYGGDILCFIGSPANLCENVPVSIITNYCRALIPYPYFMVILAILQRVGQNLSLNFELFIIVTINFFLSIPLNYIFVILFDFGYIGCALVMNLTVLFMVIMTVILLIKKGLVLIFKPLPFDIVCTKHGLYEYVSLAIPGAIQISSAWIIRELITILSGFVHNPTIAISGTVILIQFNLIRFIYVGIANATGIRIGKYVGGSSIFYAKRCIKIQIFYEICLTVIVSIIFITLRKELPRIFTNNLDVINLVSNVIYIGLLNLIITAIYQNVAAIYRALGYQRLTAYIISITQYIIALPLELWMLFGHKFHFHDNTEMGVYVIWFGSTFGYLLGDIVIIVMLIYYIDWNEALNESEMRINYSRRHYGSIDNS